MPSLDDRHSRMQDREVFRVLLVAMYLADGVMSGQTIAFVSEIDSL